MFDLPGFDEWLVIAVVAIIVIGPKDLPMALRTLGRWMAKVRTVSGHFRSGVETMIREAELEEMEKKWREQNAAIMAQTAIEEPDPLAEAAGESGPHAASAEAALPPPASKAEALARQAGADNAPQLPLSPP
jgi:sec-independent protein translocase protein TatB